MTTSELCELASSHRFAANWYEQSAAEIADVCNRENWDNNRFAAILAVTSPRVSIRRNVRITLHYMASGELLRNVMRGIGQSVRVWESTGQILGQKTSAFYAAIRGDSSAIVLDTHMANLLGVKQSAFANRKIRKQCESTIRRVAKRIGLAPAQTQAALWTGQLARVGRLPLPFPIRCEYYNWLAHNRQFDDSGVIRQFADNLGYQTSLVFA